MNLSLELHLDAVRFADWATRKARPLWGRNWSDLDYSTDEHASSMTSDRPSNPLLTDVNGMRNGSERKITHSIRDIQINSKITEAAAAAIETTSADVGTVTAGG